MKLYDYYRSSAAYRVRIALHLKGLAYTAIPVNLLQGEEATAIYRKLNPQGLVPSLQLDGGPVLTQSLALCEYLDEVHPEPPLLPTESVARAQVRALALSVACDIHPLNNLRVLSYLRAGIGVSETQKNEWYRHWIELGFQAIETVLSSAGNTGDFCWGEQPTLADLCLIPQVYNARRFEVDLTPFSNITRIERHCLALPAFDRARPERQPDPPESFRS